MSNKSGKAEKAKTMPIEAEETMAKVAEATDAAADSQTEAAKDDVTAADIPQMAEVAAAAAVAAISGKETDAAEAYVYCGPSIKDVVREGTVFVGELPEALDEYASKNPAIKSLIIPLTDFAQFRADIGRRGTAANIIYNNILSGLKRRK